MCSTYSGSEGEFACTRALNPYTLGDQHHGRGRHTANNVLLLFHSAFPRCAVMSVTGARFKRLIQKM